MYNIVEKAKKLKKAWENTIKFLKILKSLKIHQMYYSFCWNFEDVLEFFYKITMKNNIIYTRYVFFYRSFSKFRQKKHVLEKFFHIHCKLYSTDLKSTCPFLSKFWKWTVKKAGGVDYNLRILTFQKNTVEKWKNLLLVKTRSVVSGPDKRQKMAK